MSQTDKDDSDHGNASDTGSNKAQEDEDEESVVERGLFSDDDDDDEVQEEYNNSAGELVSSQGSRSVVEWEPPVAEDDLGAQSQVPRGFMERMFWGGSDIRFTNNTDREVMFIIADEEFTLQRTTKLKAGVNDGEDDDDGDDDNDTGFGLNFVPLNLSASATTTTTITRTALRTRCMPVAPRSHSTQHFPEERLTYVTAMSKDQDGEGQPWTRVHYENKVINSKRTKSLSFCRKHLKISAYRVNNKPPPKLLQKQGSKKRLASGSSTTTALAKKPSKRLKPTEPEPEIVD